MRFTAVLFVSTLAFAGPGPDPNVTLNWPQWRGPQSTGTAPDKNLPTEWSATKNVAWKTAIPGKGYSSPIVWGNRIFLSTSIEGDVIPGRDKGKHHKLEGADFVHPDAIGYDHKQTVKVLQLDAQTGKILWERTIFDGAPFESWNRAGSFASLTQVTDGTYVFTALGPDGVFAHDFQGRQIWKADPGQYGSLGVGYGASPLLYDNLLILQTDDDEGQLSSIFALDKKTGKEVWRTKRPTTLGWASPVIARRAGRDELLTSGLEFVISYNPKTGEELWRTKGLENNAVATPIVLGDMVYFSAGYPAKKTLAIRLGGSGDVAWTYTKGTGYTPSNIGYGDFLYLITDKGILSCLDAKTGDVKYDNGRPPTPARYSASPVAFDGKVFITSEDGDTHVIQAGPEHKVLGTNSLDEPVLASPAIAGGSVYIRGAKNLYKISKAR